MVKTRAGFEGVQVAVEQCSSGDGAVKQWRSSGAAEVEHCAPMGNGDDVFLGDAPIIVLRDVFQSAYRKI
ncbi:hypothetical protein Tco_0947117 [Tanacetum coccineum]